MKRHALPSSDTSDNNESLNAESIVGLRPSNQENNFLEKGEVAPISPPSMAGRGGTILSISSDTIGDSPGHSSMAGRGGTILSISSDTIGNSPGHFKSNTPDTSEVTHTRSVDKASELHNSSSNVKFDNGSDLELIRVDKGEKLRPRPLRGNLSLLLDERVKVCRYLHKVTRASSCIHLSMVKQFTLREN